MIDKILLGFYRALAAFMLIACIQVHALPTYWTGGNQTADVHITTANPLFISNTNYLANPINIINDGGTANVTITADAVITSSQELYFYVGPSETTQVNVQNDLLFSGSAGQNLLVTLSGGGELIFYISGGKTLSFSGTSTTSGGTIFLNDITGGTPTQNVIFQPATSILTQNAIVEVGANSAISFVGNSSSQLGQIVFDAATSLASTGRFILQIDDGASVLNEAAYLAPGYIPTLSNIQFNLGSGYGTTSFILESPGVNQYSGLLIVNGNTQWSGLVNNPFCELMPTTTNSIRQGFILGAGSTLTVQEGAYIDYVVTVTNVTLTPNIPNNVLNVPCQRFLTRVIKDRNPAALIIDGNPDNSDPVTINMQANSAIYFRSGVDCQGNSSEFDANDTTISFTINPANNFNQYGSEGTYLLDVEGPLIVNGDSDAGQTLGTALQILSWQVTATGGSVLINQSDTNFPLRTFAQDGNGNYLQYGSGCFFINNKVQLNQMHLQHTDEIHPIYEDNVGGQSASSYIGGDRLNICLPTNPLCPCASSLVVPAIQFYNSFFDLHTSAALTGLSIQVVNDEPFDTDNNSSQFVFYGNGRCIDNGTGRSLIIGSEVGSEASDWQTIISRDGQLDIMQTNSLANPIIDLTLSVSYNNYKITPNIVWQHLWSIRC